MCAFLLFFLFISNYFYFFTNHPQHHQHSDGHRTNDSLIIYYLKPVLIQMNPTINQHLTLMVRLKAPIHSQITISKHFTVGIAKCGPIQKHIHKIRTNRSGTLAVMELNYDNTDNTGITLAHNIIKNWVNTAFYPHSSIFMYDPLHRGRSNPRLYTAVLKNTPLGVSDTDLSSSLSTQLQLTASVRRWVSKHDKATPSRISTVSFLSLDDLQSALHIGEVSLGLGLSVYLHEDRNNPIINSQVVQCHWCQHYNHQYDTCPKRSEPQKCMYCSKNHVSRQCDKKRDRKSHHCAVCNGNHAANAVHCPERQKYFTYLSTKPKPMAPVTLPSTTTPPVPILVQGNMPSAAEIQALIAQVASLTTQVKRQKELIVSLQSKLKVPHRPKPTVKTQRAVLKHRYGVTHTPPPRTLSLGMTPSPVINTTLVAPPILTTHKTKHQNQQNWVQKTTPMSSTATTPST